MKTEINIGNKTIGTGHLPFIIAEMSGNHNGSLERALQIVDAAAASGAHALKLQTYTADTITMKNAYTINDPKSLWNGMDLYDLYSKAYTPWEWHREIFSHAASKGIIAFSSPFDETAVDFLEKLNVPAYKIASFESTHHPLLRKVASTGKPVILSTGAASLSGISESVEVLRSAGCTDLILMKCTSTYPADFSDSNLATIPHMMELFNCPIGLSDHTPGIGAAIASIALGACVIEKHFTLSRADGGVDSAFSLEPAEFRMLVEESERASKSIGEVKYGILPSEQKSVMFRRSVYLAKDMEAGEIIKEEHIRIIRPGLGIEPKYFSHLLGKKVNRKLAKGMPFRWEYIG